MVRKSEKGGERRNVYLSREVIDTIEEMSKIEGLNFSQFIDMAVMQIKESENPSITLDKIQKEIIILEKELQELKKREIEVREIINGAEKWKLIMSKKRENAIIIIRRKILQDNITDAERIAKTWSRILHCSYIELLNEASITHGV